MTKLKAPPSFPFFPNDWFGGTRMLSVAAKGAYIDLLALQWSRGFIPETQIERQRVCNVLDPEEWAAIWAEIGDKFVPIVADESLAMPSHPAPEQTHVLVNFRLHTMLQEQMPRYVRRCEINRKNRGKKESLTNRQRIVNESSHESSTNRQRIVNESSHESLTNGEKGKGKREKGRRKKGKGFNVQSIPPALDDVKAYAASTCPHVDPEGFYDYYEAAGWKFRNGQRMKDWQATMRNWERRDKGKGGMTLLPE